MAKTGKIQVFPNGKRLILPSGKCGVLPNEDDCCGCRDCCEDVPSTITATVTGWTGGFSGLNGTFTLNKSNIGYLRCICQTTIDMSLLDMGVYNGAHIYCHEYYTYLYFNGDIAGNREITGYSYWQFRGEGNEGIYGTAYGGSDTRLNAPCDEFTLDIEIPTLQVWAYLHPNTINANAGGPWTPRVVFNVY